MNKDNTSGTLSHELSSQLVIRSASMHMSFSISAPVFAHRQHKENLSIMQELHRTGEDPNACIHQNQNYFYCVCTSGQLFSFTHFPAQQSIWPALVHFQLLGQMHFTFSFPTAKTHSFCFFISFLIPFNVTSNAFNFSFCENPSELTPCNKLSMVMSWTYQLTPPPPPPFFFKLYSVQINSGRTKQQTIHLSVSTNII